MRLGVGWRLLVCCGVVSVVSLVLVGAAWASPVSTQTPGRAGQVAAKKKHKRPISKALTTAQVIALIQRYAGHGPAGPGGPVGPGGSQGPGGAPGVQGPVGPSTGPAGGDLTGNYPSPTVANGAITDTKVAAANKDGTAGTPSLRTLGTSAVQAMPGNATPGGPPTGGAGGALAGSYPNPTLNVSGGPCANGRALTNVSNLAALTCAPGVYSDANSNVAAGPNPFGALTSGINNVAVGPSMLTADTIGNNNSAVGLNALNANTTGTNNSALGQGALALNTTGNGNVAVGQGALAINTTGSFNTVVGYSANPGTTGSRNVLIGYNAGFSYGTSESSNVDVGSQGTGAESNAIHIGTDGASAGQQNKAFLAGVYEQNVTGAGTAAVNVNTTTGQLGIATSSRRFKTAIQPLGSALNGLMALRPVSFRYKPQYANGAHTLQYGLIAEDVARVYPNLVTYGRDGKPYTVAYEQLPPLLLAKIQQQQHQIDALQAQNRRLRHQQAQIDWLMHHARLR